MADGKQLKINLKQVLTNEQAEAYSKTYIFKPENKDLQKHVSIKVSSGDTKELLDKLGLPSGMTDSVIIEIGVKEIQTKLIQAEPEEKEEKDKEE